MKKYLFILALLIICGNAWPADNSELQDLDAISSPATGDILYVVDDPTGTPASKKITIGNLLDVATDLNSSGEVVGGDADTAGTATALAANGANCAAGSYPLGVDASGAVESCTDATTEIDSAITAAASNYESATSNDIDPDRLAGDTTDDDKVDTAILDGDGTGDCGSGKVCLGDHTHSSYAPLTSPTFATSITGSYLTASEILITDGSKNIVSAAVATYPSLTELSYVKGVTSAVQTQIANILNGTTAFTDFNGAVIDSGNLASTVVTGLDAVGTFESGDTFICNEAGVGLRECDYDDLPSGAGDMAKSTYDTDANDVVDAAETLSGTGDPYVNVGGVNWNIGNYIDADAINWVNLNNAIPQNTINKTIYAPNDMTNNGWIVLWRNITGYIYTITHIQVDSDASASFSLIRATGGSDGTINWDNVQEIEPIDSTDFNEYSAINWYSDDLTSGINWATIEANSTIGINWTSSDAPNFVHITINGGLSE